MTWQTPNWYVVALLALAAYRTWHLLAYDTILDPLRRRLVPSDSKREEFVQCAYCCGAWCAAGWWLAWIAWPHWSLIIAVPFAISALLAFVASHTTD